MIVIITDSKDVHADVVEARLRERGAEVCRLDWSELPLTASLSVEYRGGHKRVWMNRESGPIDFTACSAIWLRKPNRPVVSSRLSNPLLREYVSNEWYQVVQDTCNALDGAWLPGPLHLIRRADNKQLQLQLATELGLEIPPTLITSDPNEFLAFYRQHRGRLIDKLPSVTFAASQRTGNEFMRYTQPVTTRDVGYAQRVRQSPVMFQGHIPKKFELRITVVDHEVHAAEIHSQSTRRTRLDWRHYDHNHTPHRIHQLPERVRRACLDMVSRLGLRFGAIDMIVTPDDRYVFLEINPNGQWLWAEQQTGLPISDAVCAALLRPMPRSRRGLDVASVHAGGATEEMPP